MFARTLPLLVAACAVLCGSAVAAPATTSACVRGSWVASTAEANRLIHRIFATRSNIQVERGSLVATFADGKLTYGGLSIVLVGSTGDVTVKQTVDLMSKARYRVVGPRLVLGAGQYKLHYVNMVVTVSGRSKNGTPPADRTLATPGVAVPLTCSGRTLRWKVPLPAGTDGTWLTFQKERG